MIPKFRAWHKAMQRMSEVLAISYERQKVKIRHVRGTTHMTVPFDDVVLMQSTGLLDKKGNDIFEGDAVRYTWDMPSGVNATEKGKKVRISKVFWSDWRGAWAKLEAKKLLQKVMEGVE